MSPRISDSEVDVIRGRLSPSLQTTSLSQQRPLVSASERQHYQPPAPLKVFQQTVVTSLPDVSAVQNNSGDTLPSQGSIQQQYADGGQGSLTRSQPHPPSMIRSYREEQIVTESRHLPVNAMPTSYPGVQSDSSAQSSSLSSQQSAVAGGGGGGKHVRVLDASGRDVQVHAGFDEPDFRPERSMVQQSSMLSSSQSSSSAHGRQPTGVSTDTAYNDLEDIMASVSAFDVSYQNICFTCLAFY